MTDDEKRLYELTEKAKIIDSAVKAAHFRMRRTRKNIKGCKETCKQTNDLIGELNAREQHK
jgi:hypothetical protein